MPSVSVVTHGGPDLLGLVIYTLAAYVVDLASAVHGVSVPVRMVTMCDLVMMSLVAITQLLRFTQRCICGEVSYILHIPERAH